jgi:phosphonate transport system permease protein
MTQGHHKLRLWLVLSAVGGTVLASFATIDLGLAQFASADAWRAMGRFFAEFFPPDFSSTFVTRVLQAAWETLAMSALGTLLAVFGGVALAVPASTPLSLGDDAGTRAHWLRTGLRTGLRRCVRWLLNGLRAVPELVWAALLLIAAGLGPLAGTLALAVHTTGVLGRLFAEAIENASPGPALALRLRGIGPLRTFFYATLPQVLPQIMSYSLYRWENNIRAAAVLGVVGAGGLGQALAFHLGLFQMHKTATVLLGMLALVALVDAVSFAARRWLTR